MSNCKHAFGWSGHILVSYEGDDSNEDDNVIAIAPDVFARIVQDCEDLNLDGTPINVKRLGVLDSGEGPIAVGHRSTFSDGFEFYGTVFKEADLRCSPGTQAMDTDAEYLAAMKERYGLELPPCKLMVGCSSEH